MPAIQLVSVSEHAEQSRFEATVARRLVGAAHYQHRDGRVVFTDTEVDDAYEGQGGGSALALHALDTARARDERLVPRCPFIAGYIRRHDSYADLIDHQIVAAPTPS